MNCSHPEASLRTGVVQTAGLEADVLNRTGQDYVNDTVWVYCLACHTVRVGKLYKRLEQEKAEQGAEG